MIKRRKGNHKGVLNFYTVSEINKLALNLDSKFTLGNSLIGAVKLTKNADLDMYSYSGYGIRLDACGFFSLSDGSAIGANLMIFKVDNYYAVHADNRKKDIFILSEVPTDSLDGTTITVEAEYFINFGVQQKKFGLSLH